MRAIEYAHKMLNSEEQPHTRQEVFDYVAASPTLVYELTGGEYNLSDPAFQTFVEDVWAYVLNAY